MFIDNIRFILSDARGNKMNDYTNYHKFRRNECRYTAELPQYLLNILPENRNIQILDIGCGNGDILYALKKRGYKNLQGIDLDETAVRWVKRNGIACENVNVLNYKPNRKFDFIMCNHVLEHLPKQNVIPLLAYIRENLLCLTDEGSERGGIFKGS